MLRRWVGREAFRGLGHWQAAPGGSRRWGWGAILTPRAARGHRLAANSAMDL
ncbi:hypothetical protein TI01_1324 [Lysobacter sp. A03]|nr:hypothetical protein TI01_1324 [Lysobacter sp. A03]